MRAAAGRRGRDSAPRRGGPRNPLSRKSSPLFLSLVLLPDPPTLPFSLPISVPRVLSPLATDSVLRPALALAPFALLRSPFVTVTTPLVLLTSPLLLRVAGWSTGTGASARRGTRREKGISEEHKEVERDARGRGRRWRDWL